MKYVNHTLIICLAMSIAILTCIKPERDNEYDPKNPCKASISGIVYGYDYNPLIDVSVALFLDEEMMYEIRTNPSGQYQLTDIDPGIYNLEVKAPGYLSYTDTADLWAGREIDTADIHLVELLFDFEDVPINTIEPYRFHIIKGNWAVVDVPGMDHAYAGFKEDSVDEATVSLDLNFGDCYLDVMINLLSSSTGYPGACLMLKFQNPRNFYWVGIGHDYIKMYKRTGDSLAWFDSLLYEDHGVTFQYDQWYELRVEMLGNSFDIEAPGVTEFTLVDAEWPDGKLGFHLINWDGLGFSTEVLFDDLYIDTREQ